MAHASSAQHAPGPPPAPNNIADTKALQDADVAVTMDLSNPKAHMRRAAVPLDSGLVSTALCAVYSLCPL